MDMLINPEITTPTVETQEPSYLRQYLAAALITASVTTGLYSPATAEATPSDASHQTTTSPQTANKHHKLLLSAIGDSMTYGFGVSTGKDWVSDYEKISGNEGDNEGVSGKCVTDVPCVVPGSMDEDFKTDVLSKHPDVATVWGGINDITNGGNSRQVISGLRKIAHQSHRAGVPLVILTVSPIGHELEARAAEYTPAIADINNWILNSNLRDKQYVVADVAEAVTAGDGYLKPAFDKDGYHYTASGYRMVAHFVNKTVTQLVEISRPSA